MVWDSWTVLTRKWGSPLTCCIRSLTFLAPVSITDLNPELKNLKKKIVGFPWKLTTLVKNSLLASPVPKDEFPNSVTSGELYDRRGIIILYLEYQNVMSLRPHWLPPPAPSPASKCISPWKPKGGGATLRCGWEGGKEPIRTTGEKPGHSVYSVSTSISPLALISVRHQHNFPWSEIFSVWRQKICFLWIGSFKGKELLLHAKYNR